jgi:hypothetical protein
MDELNYESLDPNIREVVRWLRGLGFQTIDSGDGSKAPAMECALPFPNVMMAADPSRIAAEAHRLLENIRALTTLPDSAFTLEATYSPIDGHAVIALFGIGDDVLAATKRRG